MRRRGEGQAVYARATGQVYVLNATAAAIWELCDGDTEPSEMIAAVSELTGQPLEVASEDITRTLAELKALGLVDMG